MLSCAGIGSRLGLGLTKALLKINGRSLISLQLEQFSEVEDLRIVVGFQAKSIIEEVLSIRKDVTFIFNHLYFETKTGASFYLGAKDARDEIIEWDGDLLVHPDDVKTILNTEFLELYENNRFLKGIPVCQGIEVFAESSVNLRIKFMCEESERPNVQRFMRDEIMRIFTENDISMPNNQLDIHIEHV